MVVLAPIVMHQVWCVIGRSICDFLMVVVVLGWICLLMLVQHICLCQLARSRSLLSWSTRQRTTAVGKEMSVMECCDGAMVGVMV